jgi:hypothetical protein
LLQPAPDDWSHGARIVALLSFFGANVDRLMQFTNVAAPLPA